MKKSLPAILIVTALVILTYGFISPEPAVSRTSVISGNDSLPKTTDPMLDELKKDRISLPVVKIDINSPRPVQIEEAWYGFEEEFSTEETDTVKTSGYRLALPAEKERDKIESVRNEIFYYTGLRFVYPQETYSGIRVKIGNFPDILSAKNFRFHLRQIGFFDHQIVPDSILVIRRLKK
ncbi:MAG: hypothetical protein L6Q59_06045 [Ignavibacteriaceae bacterium]|nr:hypothetical protein [Ignavibacteriaceae bacterium]